MRGVNPFVNLSLYKAMTLVRCFSPTLFLLVLVLVSSLRAAADLNNYAGATCGAAGASVTLTFDITAGAWERAHYVVAFSADATMDGTDTFVATDCGVNSCANQGVADPGGQENGTPTWGTINVATTVPAGWAGGYVIIKAQAWGMCGSCSGGACCAAQDTLTVAFASGCGTPTFTRTVTPNYTPTHTPTRTPTFTPTATRTSTPTPTFSHTRTITNTFTVSPTFTQTPWPPATTGEIKALVVPTCAVPGSNITVSFDVRAAAWQTSYFKVAFSYDTTPDASDNWVVANGQYYSGGGLGAPLNDCTTVASQQGQGGDATVWYPQSFTLTVPPSTSAPIYVIVINNSGYDADCSSHDTEVSALLPLTCGSPTHTPVVSATPSWTRSPTLTRSPTPSATRTHTPTRSPTPTHTRTITSGPTPTITVTFSVSPTFTISPTFTASPPTTPTQTTTPIGVPMAKTINVASATIGDTITYCISWQNNTGGSTNVVIWDTLPMAMTYLGADNSGTYAPRLVTWDLGSRANGASGSVCFWAVIAGYPWLPGADAATNLAFRSAREEDVIPWLPAFYLIGARP